MIKIEFDNIEDYTEYMDNWQKNNEKCSTQEQIINEHYFAQTNIKKEINTIWENILALNNTDKVSVLEDKINQIIDLINPPKKEPVKTTNTKTINGRQYNPTIQKQLPNYRKLTNEGYFILGNGNQSKYTIQDILRLKECLKMNIGWKEMSEKVGLTQNTVIYICYGIETGAFDKFFNMWEQIQANKFYNKNKKHNNLTVNNPQKRKEMGMG